MFAHSAAALGPRFAAALGIFGCSKVRSLRQACEVNRTVRDAVSAYRRRQANRPLGRPASNSWRKPMRARTFLAPLAVASALILSTLLASTAAAGGQTFH